MLTSNSFLLISIGLACFASLIRAIALFLTTECQSDQFWVPFEHGDDSCFQASCCNRFSTDTMIARKIFRKAETLMERLVSSYEP